MAFLSFLDIGIPASSRLVFRPIYPQEVVTTTPPSTGTGGSAGRPGGRPRVRIILRINGELCEVETLKQMLECLKEVKKDLPETAKEAALNIIRTGKRIGEAKREQIQNIEIVEAPYSVRDMIQTRLDEIQRELWRRVQIWVRRLREDDDTMMLL